MNQSYCYSFRFCCDPGFNDRREIASLRRFVREAQIDDVAVFCNVEELNTGHMTEEEQETIWLRLLCDVQAALAPEGVHLSVNHWHSLMHADLGKTLPQSQPFRRMVDMDGREADLCVCPMCERWQTYFAGLYARYAALSPHILWVEDDFRLHNHDPLRWGGCFCPAHMREYARRAGKPELTREEFVRGILQLVRQANQKDGPQEALLAALKPYLRPDRREKLDRAMRIARISQIAGGALKQHGGLLGGPNDV